jgi:hypothetical protein
MGRGMIQDVGDQIFVKFTDAMRAELEAPPAAAAGGKEGGAEPRAAPAPPLDVLSLGAAAAAHGAGRSLRRPELWIAFAIVVVIALWVLARARS